MKSDEKNLLEARDSTDFSESLFFKLTLNKTNDPKIPDIKNNVDYDDVR